MTRTPLWPLLTQDWAEQKTMDRWAWLVFSSTGCQHQIHSNLGQSDWNTWAHSHRRADYIRHIKYLPACISVSECDMKVRSSTLQMNPIWAGFDDISFNGSILFLILSLFLLLEFPFVLNSQYIFFFNLGEGYAPSIRVVLLGNYFYWILNMRNKKTTVKMELTVYKWRREYKEINLKNTQ